MARFRDARLNKTQQKELREKLESEKIKRFKENKEKKW